MDRNNIKALKFRFGFSRSQTLLHSEAIYAHIFTLYGRLAICCQIKWLNLDKMTAGRRWDGNVPKQFYLFSATCAELRKKWKYNIQFAASRKTETEEGLRNIVPVILKMLKHLTEFRDVTLVSNDFQLTEAHKVQNYQACLILM